MRQRRLAVARLLSTWAAVAEVVRGHLNQLAPAVIAIGATTFRRSLPALNARDGSRSGSGAKCGLERSASSRCPAKPPDPRTGARGAGAFGANLLRVAVRTRSYITYCSNFSAHLRPGCRVSQALIRAPYRPAPGSCTPNPVIDVFHRGFKAASR